MLFWIIAIALACVATVLLILPVVRGSDASDEGTDQSDIAIYKDQLAEVDRDLERGVLDASEAERARTEIARRLLAADKAEGRGFANSPKTLGRIMAAVSALFIIGGALYLYKRIGAPGYPDVPLAQRLAAGDEMRENRISQTEAEEAAGTLDLPSLEATPEYIAMVEQLREIVPTRPDDQQGWALLARHEAALGNYGAAAEAQARLITLKGDTAPISDLVILTDLMVGAAAGYVSPEAETVVRRILSIDTDNRPAQYYLGLLYAQTDRSDVAFRIWREVVDANQDIPHTGWARDQIENAARFAGIEYELPALRGPTAEDIEAASDMSADDQSAMIQGMVGGLMERLATEGGTPAEWAQLIRALGVLGDTDRAAAIWGEAEATFAAAPDALNLIRDAARSAGVAE